MLEVDDDEIQCEILCGPRANKRKQSIQSYDQSQRTNIECPIKAEGGGQGTNHLRNQSIQVGVGGTFDIQITTADIVEGFVIETEGTVGVFQKGMGTQHAVVGFYHSSRHLRRRRDGKGELTLPAIIDTQTLQQQTSETRAGTAPGGMENQKSLKTRTVIGQLADTIQDKIHNFLPSGVMSTGVVIGGVFLAVDDLFGVVKLTVGTGSDLVTHAGF